MSQSRTRKSTKKDSAPKDAVQSPQNNHHKKKIPKSVRYDLESTLLELCDVWFQDIKPHLIKNNIKVHVNERCQRQAVGPGTCNHLNPGADRDRRRPKNVSFVNYYSTPTTVSRAPCPRQRAPTQPPDTPPPLTKNIPQPAAGNSPSCVVECSELVPCRAVRSPPRPALPPLSSAAPRPNAARPVPRLPIQSLETCSRHKQYLPRSARIHENYGKSYFNQNKIVQNKSNVRTPIAEICRRSATEQPQRQLGHKLFDSNNNVDSKRSHLTGMLRETHPVRNSETKRIIQRIYELADNPRKDERDKDRGKMNKRRASEKALNQTERDRVFIQNAKENSHVKLSPKLKTKLKRNKKIEDTRPPWR